MFIYTKNKKKTIVVLLFSIISCVWVVTDSQATSIRSNIKQGNSLFAQGQYTDSIEKYSAALEKEPESDVINFDIGTAFYKDAKYQKSIDHLQKALLTEEDELRQKALYNLGNALYKDGIAKENENIEYTIERLERALDHYKNALEIVEDDDAQHNYEFVEKELERLKQKQQQQEQQQQDQQQSDQKDDQKEQQNQDQNQQQQDQQQDQQQQDERQKDQQSSDEGEDSQKDQQKSSDAGDNKDQKGEGDKEQGGQQDQQQGEDEQEKQQGEGEQQKSSSDQPQGQSSGKIGENELSEYEAQMLLDNYQQSEEPKGLLNMYQGPVDSQPVLKDW